MRHLLLLSVLFYVVPISAQTPGTCEHGIAQADLDASDVRATLFNSGNLFYGPGESGYITNAYVVPKASGNRALFAANLWVGGTVNGELRVAAATFLDFEMWPGPLEPGATLPNPDDCSAYDRIWVVSTLDIQAYDDTGIATSDLAEWPVDLGAEVIDGDGIANNYDLEGGDRPRIYGTQTAFWVMNDVGNEHVRTESAPLGIEVQVTAFAISSTEAFLNQATFYRIHVINRNTLTIEDARFSFWADTDLGDASDDLQGVDTLRALGYTYNSAESDPAYGNPPATGVDFLNGELGSVMYYVNSTGPLSDPTTKVEVDRLQRSFWIDGTPLTAFGSGYATDGPPTVWAFPADPVTGQFWSQENVDGGGTISTGANSRRISSSLPFTLSPGEAATFDIGFLFAQGEDRLDSITELRAASDLVQSSYDDGTLFDARLPVASENGDAAALVTSLDSVYPNPVRTEARIVYALHHAGPARLSIHDVLGREVARLMDQTMPAGPHHVYFDATGLASGIYVVVLEASGERQSRKLLLVR